MKKDIAKVLRECTEKLPVIYEWEEGSTIMKGWELNLTPLADKRKFEKYTDYVIPVPQMRAVIHDQQVKDAYKKQGSKGVRDYIDKVLTRAKNILSHVE
jgi:hypothetical protein